MKKLTTYKEVKEYCYNNLGGISIDDYTDEENIQISKWLIQAMQESLLDEELLDLTESEITMYSLNNQNIINNIVNESEEIYVINEQKIIGTCIINYPAFKIIKEKNKNNFYRIYN
jgi:hypothetical protein